MNEINDTKSQMLDEGNSHIRQINASEKLCEIVERIEEIEKQKADVSTLLKEVYNEAKREGFDTKIIRQVIRMRKMKQYEIEQEQNILVLYLQSLGMLGMKNIQ